MPTVGTTSRPGYVYDQGTDTWIPIGVGPHSHDTSSLVPYSGFFAAGKNKIINGDFRINQRAFTSTTTNGVYGFDRFFLQASDGTTTWTAETFTPGAAPVAGYEGTNYSRIVSTGQTLSSAQSRIRQNIEDVRTFAGQTVTVSFWAKAASGTPNIVPSFAQVFGSGGSANVFSTTTKQAITTSWARYSFIVNIPSVSGKTIGTSSYLSLSIYVSAGSDSNATTDSLGIQSNTFDIWGVQVEAGSVATPFQTATGTLAGEFAAACRYYYRWNSGAASQYGSGFGVSTTEAYIQFQLPVPMRVVPTSIEASAGFDIANGATSYTTGTYAMVRNNTLTPVLSYSGTTGLVQNNFYQGYAGATTEYLAFSAEL